MRRSIEVNQDRVQTPHLPPPPSILSSPVDEELPPPTYETVTANPIAGANSPSVTLAPPSPRMPHQHPVVPRIQTPSLVPAPNTTPPSTVPESSRADPTSPGGGVGGFVLRGFPPSSSPAGAGLSPVISPMMNPGGHAGLSPRMKPTSNLPESPGAGPSGSGSGSQQHPPPPSQPDTSPGGNTIFLDSSYMENVSFGHFAPELTQHLLPTPSGFPSKIVLHPEQAYHIRAPSWKGLLRLLAALGDTTLEPSPEAFDKIQIPSHQTSLNLRIILHFHKNKYGPDWTVIVWLDLDRGLPNIETYKYTRGDTTMLPFNHRVPEWTLGNAGQLAINSTGDITSSMTSIFYVLPNPFAGLPMPVSNLAAVLTTALMDSKKAMHLPTSNNGAGSNAASPFDPIASQRRLYKAVEKCFPQGKKGKVTAGVIEGKEEEVKIVGKKGGMTRWMSNVVGVVTRPKEVKGGQHGNDDTYVELITPYTLT
ncbi:hypothetical protein FRC03_002418 [Tulasnella sp. 419]|nr:hypothetical protein FRC03_002418 [Tulasnella sp. 419]